MNTHEDRRTTDQATRPRGAVGVGIRGLYALVGAGLALCAIALWLALIGIPPLSGEDTWVPASTLPQIHQLEIGDTAARTEVSVLPLWLRAVGISSTVLWTAMLVITARAVALLARRAAQGRPFADDVLRRLRHLVIWLLALAAARVAVDLFTASWVSSWFEHQMDTTQAGGVLSTEFPSFSLPYLVAALVAAILGLAFRQGRALVEETEGLV